MKTLLLPCNNNQVNLLDKILYENSRLLNKEIIIIIIFYDFVSILIKFIFTFFRLAILFSSWSRQFLCICSETMGRKSRLGFILSGLFWSLLDSLVHTFMLHYRCWDNFSMSFQFYGCKFIVLIILCVFLMSFIFRYTLTMLWFCPRHNLPEFLKNRFVFSSLLITMSATASILSIFRPYINAFALMTLIIPTVYLLWAELLEIKSEEADVWNLGIRSLVLMVIINYFLMTINYAFIL